MNCVRFGVTFGCFCLLSIKNFTINGGGGGFQLPNWWWLRKLVARSAMGRFKLGIPETGFVGKRKVCLLIGGVGGGV